MRIVNGGLGAAILGLAFIAASPASAVILIHGSTTGAYNNELGTILDCGLACDNDFPEANSASGDPVKTVTSEPNLSAANGFLGDWLSNTSTPTGSGWDFNAPIPAAWAVNTETAIVYEFFVTEGVDNDVTARFGVDNGIYVWLDGAFIGGELRPGGAFRGEHVFSLGSLTGGTHYLQVLREDHGGATGYKVKVKGKPGTVQVPEPSTLALIGMGLLGLGLARRRSKTA